MTTAQSSDYTTGTNQGIVDGRPEGQQPSAQPVTLDTYIDSNASASAPVRATASDTLTGATSADVYESAGRPGKGQTSNELHHGGQQGGKRHPQGVDRWGPPDAKTEVMRSREI